MALALGGGGARGVAHLGVLKVLERAQLPIHLIVGTSAGALIGAGYALTPDVDACLQRARGYLTGDKFRALGLDQEDPLEAEQTSFIGHVFHYFRRGISFSMLLRRKSIYHAGVLDQVVAELVPDKAFADAVIPLAVPALDLSSGDEVVLTRGSIRPAVVASCSIPGFFPPVRLGHRSLVDAGVIGSVPADAARDMGADIVIAVDLTPPLQRGLTDDDLKNGLEIMFRVEDIGGRRFRDAQLAHADVVIHPVIGSVRWNEFRDFDESVEIGMKAAEAKLPEILAKLKAP